MAQSEQPGRARVGHSKSAWLLFGFVVILAAVLVYFVGWLPRHKRQEAIEQEANHRTQQKPRVDVQEVRRAPATSELMIPGTSQPYTEAYIYARASGYLSKRFVDIGDRVHAGQLLALIDAPDLDQQVAQAQSTVRQSESNVAQMEAQLHLQAVNWDRYKVLVAKGVFSRQQGDQQEADYHVAEANVEAARSTVQANRDNLQRLRVLQQYERVTAPFNGIITTRNVDVGALISAQGSGLGLSSSTSSPGPTQAGVQGNNAGSSGNVSGEGSPSTGGAQGGQLFGIANIDRLRILVSVPEAYSAAIHPGQRARLSFQELPDEHFEGRVTRTSSSIDQNTRTLLVEVQVPNPRVRLLPGMYVVVNFVSTQNERPLLVPGEAIVVRDAKQMVATVKNNVVHFCPVTIGRDYGDQTEITGGLNEGDVIATTITDEVRDGVEIEPQYKKQGQQAGGGQGGQRAGQSGQYGDQKLDDTAEKSGSQQGGKQQNSARPGTK